MSDELVSKSEQQKSGGELPCDMVMLSIGVKPNLDLAKSAGLDIGEVGGIKVNEHMQTSDLHIYAVGDAVETTNLVTGKPALVPLAGIAARQSRIAVNNIYGREEKYRGTLGTSLVKVFELAVGTVGVNEKTLKRLGMEYEKCYLHPFSHVTYYPDSAQMNMKFLLIPLPQQQILLLKNGDLQIPLLLSLMVVYSLMKSIP